MFAVHCQNINILRQHAVVQFQSGVSNCGWRRFSIIISLCDDNLTRTGKFKAFSWTKRKWAELACQLISASGIYWCQHHLLSISTVTSPRGSELNEKIISSESREWIALASFSSFSSMIKLPIWPECVVCIAIRWEGRMINKSLCAYFLAIWRFLLTDSSQEPALGNWFWSGPA